MENLYTEERRNVKRMIVYAERLGPMRIVEIGTYRELMPTDAQGVWEWSDTGEAIDGDIVLLKNRMTKQFPLIVPDKGFVDPEPWRGRRGDGDMREW